MVRAYFYFYSILNWEFYFNLIYKFFLIIFTFIFHFISTNYIDGWWVVRNQDNPLTLYKFFFVLLLRLIVSFNNLTTWKPI